METGDRPSCRIDDGLETVEQAVTVFSAFLYLLLLTL